MTMPAVPDIQEKVLPPSGRPREETEDAAKPKSGFKALLVGIRKGYHDWEIYLRARRPSSRLAPRSIHQFSSLVRPRQSAPVPVGTYATHLGKRAD